MKKRVFCLVLFVLMLTVSLLPVRGSNAETELAALSLGEIVGSNVAFRKSASTSGKLIARLAEGTVVRLIEGNVNAEWFKVEYADKTGYVNRMFVNIEKSLSSYQFEYTGTVVNCNEYINVRDDDSVSGAVLGTVAKGAALNVTEAYHAPAWHQISYDGKTGYVSAKYVQLAAKVDNNSLTGITVDGGELSPTFSPKEYGYVIAASQEEVTIKATANDGVKVSIGNTGISSAKYTIRSGNSKTIRISVNGKVRYSLYLVRDVLTIGTWNIKRGNEHLLEQGFMIAAQKPDIIGIQEVYVNKSDGSNNLLSLRTYNAQNTAFASTLSLSAGGDYGIGQISRYTPVSNEKFKLESGDKEQRYVQRVVYNIGGRTLSVYNTHLTWESAAIRKTQFAAILKLMDEDTNEYKVLTGDFNAKESEFAGFKKNYKIVNTSSTKFYDYSYKRISFNQIDNIIVSNNISVLNARAIPTTFSDHYPLFAFLALK